MHECPECGQACDCDGEDTWFDLYPSCIHECEETDDDDSGYSDYLDGREEPYDGPGTYDYECLAVEAEMKREISFFKDRRATTSAALLETLRALGMSDEEIRAELLKLRAAQQPAEPDASPEAGAENSSSAPARAG